MTHAAPAYLSRDVRAVLVLSVGVATSAVLSLLFVVVVARRLEAAQAADFFGAVFLVMLLSTALSPLNGSMAQLSSGDDTSRRSVASMIGRRLLRYSVPWGLLFVTVGGLLTFPMARLLKFGSPLQLWIALLAGALTAALQIPRGLLRGAHDFRAYSANMILESVVRFAVGVPLVWLTSNATAALVAYPIALVAALAAAVDRSPPSRAVPDEIIRGQIRAVGRLLPPLIGFASIDAAFQYGDVLLIKSLLPVTSAADYGAAATVARVIAIVFAPFALAILPIMSDSHASGVGIGRPLRRLLLYFTGASAIVVIACALAADALIRLAYGPSFGGAAPLLVPFALSVTVGCINIAIGQAAAATGGYGFLCLYVAGFALMLIGFTAFHATAPQVLGVAIVAKAVTALAGILHLRTRDAGSGARALSVEG